MPMPLSKELREKIIYHKINGAKNAEIIKWLQVSKNSVTRIWSLYKEQNSVEPKPHNRGRKPAFGSDMLEKIIAKIMEQPDITLEELIEEFGLKLSISALSRKLTKKNLTFKKRRYFQRSNFAPTFSNSEKIG